MRLRLNGWHPMARLRLCALLLLVPLVCTAVVSAEMQACDPVSAHPEGKIVCRPFGPSATSSVPSPPLASSDAIQQIGQLIDKYGEPAIIAFIRARRSGHITLSVGTGFRTFYGSPNPSYVTPQTILMDLEALRLSPTQLEATLQEQAARTEQTRQATAQQNLKDEAERQRKTRADIAAQARARERAEAEASEKWEREAKAKMKAEEERLQQAQAGVALPTAPQPSSSSKGNLSWLESACKATGEAAREATKARDRGATYTQLVSSMRDSLAKTNPTDPRTREAHEMIFLAMIKEIFEKRWLTPERVQQDTEFACIQGISRGLSQR